MNRPPAAVPALALLVFGAATVAGCSHDAAGAAVMQSADGRYRVVFQGEGRWIEAQGREQMESALARAQKIDVVYAHNDPMAHGAVLAARQQDRKGIVFVGVDALPDEGRRYVRDGLLDVTVEYPTCAAAALDLALLACSGKQVPREIVVGTRVYTKANIDKAEDGQPGAGGRPVPSPGDIMLASLRHENAEVLTTQPTTDQVFRIGMAQCNDAEPWREAMREDMKAWDAAHPQVELSYRDAQNDTEKQRSIVQEFVAQKFNAIIVSPKESLALARVCKDAMAAGIHVIVLDRKLGSDDFTCFVGGDNTAIGRAVGEEIKRLLPTGGDIVEIEGLMTSSPAQERHQGFAEALGLAAPKPGPK